MIGRNDDCWCGSGKKWKKCHFPHSSPKRDSFGDVAAYYRKNYDIIVKTPKQIEGIRRAGHLAAQILAELCAKAKAGVTTLELDTLARQLYKDAGAIPATLGYGSPPYPATICTSLNEVICHGIPDERPLQNGDIMNIDVTAILDGYFGDCSRMVTIGEISPEKQLVTDVSYQCLMRSIAILKPGVLVKDIGDVIDAYATAHGCSVVTMFVAHGVGIEFHEGPQVPHCLNSVMIPLVEGMTFTIEPMINAGVPDGVVDKSDKWTARTRDGKASAQWEHTLVITADGAEILTPWPNLG